MSSPIIEEFLTILIADDTLLPNFNFKTILSQFGNIKLYRAFVDGHDAIE